MKKALTLLLSTSLLCVSLNAFATLTVSVKSTDAQQNLLGNVIFTDTQYGLLITPELHGLPTGLHGFHIHVEANCGEKGQSAGGHLDPKNTKKHLGPYNDAGHLGDLPALYVDEKGNATTPTLAPRLKEADITKHSLMIHSGADNYSDFPAPLGNGGGRIACGVIEKSVRFVHQ